MVLIAILAATLVAGIGSVWIAAALGHGLLARFTPHMLSLAAGALLATAFMHLLPEAFDAGADPRLLFTVLLVGLVLFFLLDKAQLYHHAHEHPHAVTHDHSHAHAHHDHHGHAHGGAGGAWAVLTGDGVHAFGDGILIASAFIADPRLGLLAALAVMAHEVPHHIGDLVVLRRSSPNPRIALVKVSLAGAVTTLGGLFGYLMVERLHALLPYFLVVAASSFVYVALADLIPQLQKRLGARQTLAQVAWLLVGMALVMGASLLAHGLPLHGGEVLPASHAGHGLQPRLA